MERAGFIVTVLAGFLTCSLLAWQGFAGVGADWVSGFLCVLWSLLMLFRLMALTTPNTVRNKPHLAQKIIFSLHEKSEDNRSLLLQNALNTSFALFVILGFLLCSWSLVYSLYAHAPDESVSYFFAENGRNAFVSMPLLFDWGQMLLYLLCISMMGFLLRTYAYDAAAIRCALLVVAGYAAGGLVMFSGLTPQWGLPENLNFAGYHNPSEVAPLIDHLAYKIGILGVVILAAMAAMPFVLIWMSRENTRHDRLVVICGTIVFAGLAGSLFVGANPALGGFAFLCAMGLFMAWGASDRSTLTAVKS